ncbi:MAG: hypothetical protein Q8J74_02775 [Candidatus Didemnitutus sp.]|nr:hypothetical protein [Candidatus Didemnitutus sp.]
MAKVSSFQLRPDFLDEVCWREFATGEMVARTDEEQGCVIARDMVPAVQIEFRRPIRSVVRQEWYVIFGGIPIGETQPLAFLADGVHQIALPRAGLFAYVVERMHLMLGAAPNCYPVILPKPISAPAERRILSSHALLYRVSTSTAFLVPTDYGFTYLLKHNRISIKEDDNVEF